MTRLSYGQACGGLLAVRPASRPSEIRRSLDCFLMRIDSFTSRNRRSPEHKPVFEFVEEVNIPEPRRVTIALLK